MEDWQKRLYDTFGPQAFGIEQDDSDKEDSTSRRAGNPWANVQPDEGAFTSGNTDVPDPSAQNRRINDVASTALGGPPSLPDVTPPPPPSLFDQRRAEDASRQAGPGASRANFIDTARGVYDWSKKKFNEQRAADASRGGAPPVEQPNVSVGPVTGGEDESQLMSVPDNFGGMSMAPEIPKSSGPPNIVRNSSGGAPTVFKGYEKQSPEFKSRFDQLSSQYGYDPEIIKHVIQNESGWNPQAVNQQTEDKGRFVGLNQIDKRNWQRVAAAAGQPDASWDDYVGMTAEQQLPFTFASLKLNGLKPGEDAGTAGLRNGVPAAIGLPDDTVIARKGSQDKFFGEKYSQNKVWEQNPGWRDGDVITVGSVKRHYTKGGNAGAVGYEDEEAQMSRPGLPPGFNSNEDRPADSQTKEKEDNLYSLAQERANLDKRALETRAQLQRDYMANEEQSSSATQELEESQMRDAETRRKESEKKRADIEKRADSEIDNITKLADNPPDGRIVENRFWTDSNVLGQVGLVITALASGFLGKHDTIPNIVKQDVENQKFQIQNSREDWQKKLAVKNNLVGYFYQKMGNLDQASAAAERYYLNQAQRKVKSIQAGKSSQQAKDASAAIDRDLDAAKQSVDLGIRERVAASAAEAEANRQRGYETVKMASELGNAGYETKGKVGDVEFKTPDASGGAKLTNKQNDLLANIATTASIIKDLDNIPEETTVPGEGNLINRGVQKTREYVQGEAGAARSWSPNEHKMQILRNQGMGMIANLRGTGIISPGEEPGIRSQLNGGPKEMKRALEILHEKAVIGARAQGIMK